MASQTGVAMAKKSERTPTPVPSPALPELPERWSLQWNQQEVMLRLLRGEPLGQVCRETQVPVHDLEIWQRRFLEAGLLRLLRIGHLPRTLTGLSRYECFVTPLAKYDQIANLSTESMSQDIVL